MDFFPSKLFWTTTLLLPGLVGAGSIKVYEHDSGAEITGATITCAWADTGMGEIALIERKFTAINHGDRALTLSVKKVEPSPLQEGVAHSFCFAGYCYSSRVFESPYAEALPAGASDRDLTTGFKASYAFDKGVVKPGIEKVAYVFFDKTDPKDSAIVYVDYDTRSLAAAIVPRGAPRVLALSQRAGKGGATLFKVDQPGAGLEAMRFRLTDFSGRYFPLTLVTEGKDGMVLSARNASPGIYWFSATSGAGRPQTVKVWICR